MKFYEIDNALQEAITAADKLVRLKVQIDDNGYFITVFEQDIIEANFYSIKEAAGGVSSRGEILLENPNHIYSFASVKPGTEVKVSFSIGEGLPYFKRFHFYLDDKGIQDIKGPGRKRFVYLGLQDMSAKLRKIDDAKDWTAPAIFTYSVVSDKSQSEKSLIHNIASRGGFSKYDIDCSTIPVTLPYVRLRRNVWAELSGLAAAYRCHLECTPDKHLLFTNSPYQTNEKRKEKKEESIFTFTGEDIFYLRKIERADLYRNTVRLKVNMPVSLEKQEVWSYDEPPVFYDNNYQPYYPFRFPLVREIEKSNYEAGYKIKEKSHLRCGEKRKEDNEKPVVYADQIDTKEEAESRLIFDGGAISYSQYDVTSFSDKAVLRMEKTADGDLFNASIHGRPIVLDLNRSCFLRDSEAVQRLGAIPLNVTGSYFSEYEIDGIPHYEDWVRRELAERLRHRREFFVKTHRGIFNVRVGARVKIKMKKEESEGTVIGFSLRYKKDKAFVSAIKILE